MSNETLSKITFSPEERRTLSLNHLDSYEKEIPDAAASAKSKLINQKYKSTFVVAMQSHKPISKMELES